MENKPRPSSIQIPSKSPKKDNKDEDHELEFDAEAYDSKPLLFFYQLTIILFL